MSVWPQAVWIVKKLQQKLDIYDIQTEINNYIVKLQQLDTKIADLTTDIENIELNPKTIIASNNQGNPSGIQPQNLRKWTTWLIT